MTVYSQASADGRLDGFAADPTPYYRLGFRWPVDAILVGSVTAVEAGDERVDLAGALRLLAERHGVRRVRTDGGGRLTGALLAAGCVDRAAAAGPHDLGISGREASGHAVGFREPTRPASGGGRAPRG